ncbi:glycosyltransferase family 1 protein [Variovorax rhizosphaerae]|uniref:Glycosyltransferase family 1 protein n=1 Tax=Variovorax rhizosphaerae TaxID=1836200 RepID=A0ABU8WHT8_9BURK
MHKENLIWIDLTTSLYWKRPAVGIVRVEQECCRWILTKLKDRVRICAFDSSEGQFKELEAQEAWEVLRRDRSPPESLINPAAAPTSSRTAEPVSCPAAAPAAPLGLASHIKQVLRKLVLATLSRIPLSYQPAVRSKLIAIRRTLAGSYKDLKTALVGDPTTPVSEPASLQAEPSRSPIRPLAHFQQGDTYLTMGLDWDHGNKLDLLYRAKKRTGLRVLNFAYDIIPVKFPHYYPSGKFELFSTYFATMGWTADRIICISECTARDLGGFLEQVGAPRPSMSVVRLGDTLPATMNSGKPSPKVAELLGAPFLLAVSTIEIRKNHECLYRAYIRLIESGFDVPKLVLVGMLGWRVDDFIYSLRNDPRVEDKIVILDQVTDADLVTLYRHCLFTLYPSLYEGWGLPVAESLAYGKFCLASNAASIPEIAGDILDYVDPWDVPQWTEKIRLYCADPAALRSKEQLIANHYRLSSWENTADQVIAAIDNVPHAYRSGLIKAHTAPRAALVS